MDGDAVIVATQVADAQFQNPETQSRGSKHSEGHLCCDNDQVPIHYPAYYKANLGLCHGHGRGCARNHSEIGDYAPVCVARSRAMHRWGD